MMLLLTAVLQFTLMCFLFRAGIQFKSLANAGEFFWYGILATSPAWITLIPTMHRLRGLSFVLGVVFGTSVMYLIFVWTPSLPETSVEVRER
jgi:uncharacterized membrane-anchored protein